MRPRSVAATAEGYSETCKRGRRRRSPEGLRFMLKMNPDHGEPVYGLNSSTETVSARGRDYPLPLANFALPFSMSASARFGPQRSNGRNALSCI